MKTTSLDVSIIVISKDEPELDGTLTALEGQLRDFRKSGLVGEILVVDKSSKRLDHVREKHSTIKWFDYDGPQLRKITIPHQRNFGIKVSRGRIIVFIDCGANPIQGWLQALVSPIIKGEAVATCGRVVPTMSDFYGIINDFAPGEVVKAPPSCNIAIQKDTAAAIGLFDETFDYGSDADFDVRLIKSGHSFAFAPGAEIVLDWGDSSRNMRRGWYYGLATARMFRKHRNDLKLLIRDFNFFNYPIYGLWIVLLTASTLLVPVLGSIFPLIVISLLVVPVVRNLGDKKLIIKISRHLVGGLAFDLGIFYSKNIR